MFDVAVQHHRAGRLEEAVAGYRRALERTPDLAEAHHYLGDALDSLGRSAEAADSFRRAVTLKPDLAAAWNGLGGALQAQGRLAEAADCFGRVCALAPGYAGGFYNLGYTLQGLGRLDEAAAAYRRALALNPDHGKAHNNLGSTLKGLGRLDEAIEAFRSAVRLAPDQAELHYTLGNALLAARRLGEAVETYRQAIALRPDYADAWTNLGNAFQSLGRLREAVEAYERAIALRPGFAAPDSNRLLCLLYDSEVSPETLLAEHRRWDARVGGRTAPPASSYPSPRDPERRLRIGYVSADFSRHPVGYFLAGVLPAHAAAAVEVFAYSNGATPDDMTEVLRAGAHQWREIAGVSDDTAEAMIRRDGIDILVDLSGHTSQNRLPLFTRRPAPVQASWLGYPSTTGLSEIDYLLMDSAAVPPGAERWCSEAVVRLGPTRFCYAPPDYAPAVSEAHPDRPVVFGSFNNLSKVGPMVIALWAEVLKAAPGSKLVLKWSSLADPDARRRLEGLFATVGIEAGRLDLRGPSPHAAMLDEYGGIDIALDPFPFCGGLTSCEALWMGVPVVTLPGERIASRQTLGFLEALGLGDLAATSGSDYVRIAAALADDPGRRAALRCALRPRMAASPLVDGRRFTPRLEAAYRGMWRRRCAGEEARGFDLSDGT